MGLLDRRCVALRDVALVGMMVFAASGLVDLGGRLCPSL